MLMDGLGHGWAGSSASVAAAVARPLEIRARSRLAVDALKPSVDGNRGCLVEQ